VFAFKEQDPTATFLQPVLTNKALLPTAVLSEAVELFCKASKPTAVLLEPVVFES